MVRIGAFSIFEIIGILSIVGAVCFLIYKLYKKYTITFIAVIVTVIISGVGYFVLSKKAEYFIDRFCQRDEIVYYYDSDPRNDIFIKGNLSHSKMKRLDYILMLEKKNESMTLPANQLLDVARYDLEVIEAYQRWTKCKNMRRSYHHVVYPDERKEIK